MDGTLSFCLLLCVFVLSLLFRQFVHSMPDSLLVFFSLHFGFFIFSSFCKLPMCVTALERVSFIRANETRSSGTERVWPAMRKHHERQKEKRSARNRWDDEMAKKQTTIRFYVHTHKIKGRPSDEGAISIKVFLSWHLIDQLAFFNVCAHIMFNQPIWFSAKWSHSTFWGIYLLNGTNAA